MTCLEIATAPGRATPRLPRTWLFLGSAIVGIVTYGAMILGFMVTLIVVMIRYVDPESPEAQLRALIQDGGFIAAGSVAGCPLVLLVLWIAIRLARRRFASYLALRWPRRRELTLGLLLTLAISLLWQLAAYLSGQTTPADLLEIYRTARADGLLWLLLIMFCIAAPITEEFVFRGFLFRGWSRSFLGWRGTIVLTSMAWTALHAPQYNWFHLADIFIIGLVFGCGFARVRHGSR